MFVLIYLHTASLPYPLSVKLCLYTATISRPLVCSDLITYCYSFVTICFLWSYYALLLSYPPPIFWSHYARPLSCTHCFGLSLQGYFPTAIDCPTTRTYKHPSLWPKYALLFSLVLCPALIIHWFFANIIKKEDFKTKHLDWLLSRKILDVVSFFLVFHPSKVAFAAILYSSIAKSER